MFVVIFKAEIKQLDDSYYQLALELRGRAFAKYHCVDFVSSCENGKEIALSYWHSLEDIKHWKNDALHQKAQQLGREKWYENYSVEITRLI